MNEWFKKITVKEYDDLIKNKSKMYNISKNFTTPELMNKYRDEDEIINKKIEIKEQQILQNENLSKTFDKNLNKYFNEHQILQNENLSKAFDKNLNKYFNEKEDISKYNDTYSLKNNNDIINSFNKIFEDYNLKYTPKSNTNKVKIQYLLNKLEKSKKVSDNLFKYFDSNLRNMKKLNMYLYLNRNRKLDLYDENSILQLEEPNIQTVNEENTDTISVQQEGQGVLNNIKIDENSLNKNILKIRYLNGRKLNNKLLKHDYKISKNMKDAIKFNKNVHQLSSNEKNIYYELEKYINKDKSLDVLIGSYVSGNNDKKLYNRINKILYNKYKNNLITYNEYTNLLNKINNT